MRRNGFVFRRWAALIPARPKTISAGSSQAARAEEGAMAVPTTAEHFLELACRGGLLDLHTIQNYLQGRRQVGTPAETSPRALAEALVRDGVLTRFQVEQLMEGRWRNFILSGKYKILGPLGAGGMGSVFLCEHQVMRRRVAVKVLPVRRANDPAALERFRREARAVAQVKHPNIVSGYDIDQDGKVHFLVMEYIDGCTLYSIIKQGGPMDSVRAAHYIRQAALGLQNAHEAGLVHRDVKPSNILLDRSGTIKILDLGLARFFHDEADDLSRHREQSPLGTSDYMAPEQALNSHHADIRADIYSLGATFYALLAGHSPFRQGSPLQKLICHQFQQPTPIRELRPDVPEDLAAVLERMMAKEPAERYQTPLEVALALAAWTQTPIPPPTPEEMPQPGPMRRGPDEAAASALPASLFGPAEPPVRSETEVVYDDEGPLPTPHSRETQGGSPVTPVPPDSRRPAAVKISSPEFPLTAERNPKVQMPALRPPSGRIGDQLRSWMVGRQRWLLAAGGAVVVLGAVVVGLLLNRSGSPSPLVPAGPPEQPVPAAEVRLLRLLVPAYYYPSDAGLAQWDRILAPPVSLGMVVIMNPDSGPGKSADPNFAKVLERARRSGVTTIGYVSTKYGGRPLDQVKADIDRWVRFYPGIAGIFLDEQASAEDEVLYYLALYEYIHKNQSLALVIGNPGAICAEEYVARPAVDVACLAEVIKDFDSYRPPGWAAHYPQERFAALLCKTATAAEMSRSMAQMRDKRIGYCFITDADEPNPWGRLPSYWEAEVEAVKQANGP
jgi:serine/threonine protein kinase